jgi:hypothetical protein
MNTDFYWSKILSDTENSPVNGKEFIDWTDYMLDPDISRFRDVIIPGIGLEKLQKMVDSDSFDRCISYSECDELGQIVKKTCPDIRKFL